MRVCVLLMLSIIDKFRTAFLTQKNEKFRWWMNFHSNKMSSIKTFFVVFFLKMILIFEITQSNTLQANNNQEGINARERRKNHNKFNPKCFAESWKGGLEQISKWFFSSLFLDNSNNWCVCEWESNNQPLSSLSYSMHM